MTAMWPTAENPAFGSFVSAQVHQLRQAGVRVDVMVLKGRSRKLMYLKGIWELRRRLAARPADLIHAHYAYVGWVARTQGKAPVVVTYHGDDAMGTIDARGRRTRASRVISAFCRSLAPLVDAVIVQSKQMASWFRSPNVHIVPHEVDLEVFQPADRDAARRALGLSLEKKYILFAANPDIAVKNFPLAQAAVDLLRQKDASVELVVVSRETQPRLALYMSACDALVFPSYQEGSPNVIKQAMACNLPIVATDVGDVAEVIGGTAGCYVCPPQADRFAQKLSEILRSRMRTRGRENVRHLSGPLVARRVIEVYERALRRRAGLLNAKTQTAG